MQAGGSALDLQDAAERGMDMLLVFICIICAVLLIFFWIQATRNHAVVLEEAVKTASSDIRVQEKRRIDLIYNLVDCVKEYSQHEASVLADLASRMNPQQAAENPQIRQLLNAAAYQYPLLKSNEVYLNLMNELSMTENLIARYRENYNGTVNAYERYIRQFPAALFLPLTGYQDQVFNRIDFEVSPDAPQDLFGRRRNTQ